MTTKKQKEANRRTAKKSTGPRSKEGKGRASRNAVEHDPASRRVVLKDEDQAAYLEHRIGICEDLRPLGCLESALANRIAAQTWRLARIPAIEVEIIDEMRLQAADGKASLAAIREQVETTRWDSLARLSGYEMALELSLTRLLAEYRRAQDGRHKLEAAETPVFEHASRRNVRGGMESLECEPDGSFRRREELRQRMVRTLRATSGDPRRGGNDSAALAGNGSEKGTGNGSGALPGNGSGALPGNGSGNGSGHKGEER